MYKSPHLSNWSISFAL